MTGDRLSRGQQGKLHAVLGELRVTDRGEKLRLLTGVLYRPVSTSSDLTYSEAKVAIDMLQGIAKTSPDPTSAVERVAAEGDRLLAQRDGAA